MTKKIDKIIIYYNDGTFEEVKTGVHDVAHKQDPIPVVTSSLTYPPGVRTLPSVWPYANQDKYTIATNGMTNVDVSKRGGREFT